MPTSQKPIVRVTGLRRREDTVLRLGGSGDNFHMTWGPDDRQYVAVDDGHGWFDPPRLVYNSRLWALSGGPEGAVFEDVPGYPELDLLATIPARSRPLYYSFGTLAVGERIYQFLSTEELTDEPGDLLFVGAKLIHSPDLGRTWRNQDGSPLTWESWGERRHGMVFYREPQDAFSVLSILQMGKAYEQNRDGYVYVYGSNGSIDGDINELVMFRVPVDRILEREGYEYFAGLRHDGGADWSSDIERRAVVCRFPLGYATPHAHTWVPSLAYIEPLGLYMMANFGMAWMNPGEDFASRPSYLGFWTAPNPWGPWTQVHEEAEWYPGGDRKARAYEAQIAPKWIAEDGRSFWLVWSDFQGDEHKPYYAFNTQRVDLLVD